MKYNPATDPGGILAPRYYYQKISEVFGSEEASATMKELRSRAKNPTLDSIDKEDEDKQALARQKALEDTKDYQGQDNAQTEGDPPETEEV